MDSKQVQIAEELRDRIVTGEFTPGTRLPTHNSLQNHYAASRATVQRAIDELREEGFLRSKGRAGTFVCEQPPHLSRYALVMPQRPSAQVDSWPGFTAALTTEALALQGTRGHVDLSIFYDMGQGRFGQVEQEASDARLLSDQVKTHQVAGLIFAFPPYHLSGSPLMLEPGIARVAMMRDVDIPGVCVVYPNLGSFIDRALDFLVARGRRRIGIIAVRETDVFMRHLSAGIAARQLECRPYWTQIVSHLYGRGVRNVVHLLMHEGQPERPDGLVITDDNLVPHATAGLIAAGVRVPEDVDVVAHCNFPRPTPAVVEVTRLGFDARQLLKACIARIDEQHRGERPQALTLIPALFADEIQNMRRSETPAHSDR